MSFPVFDLAAFERSDDNGKRQMGREVDLICRASGFLAVENHGVPEAQDAFKDGRFVPQP